MDLNTITVQDFKDQFPRDFPYLPIYSSTTAYKIGNIVFYEPDTNFYKCLIANTGNIPPDFPTYWGLHDTDILNYILDSDIERAFVEAKQSFNQGLFSTEDIIKLGYLYLTAHFLANDITVSEQGIYSSGAFPVKKRKVGNVQEDYNMPKWIDNPVFNFYTKTGYGLKYLNMVMPKLTGHISLLPGNTTPSWQTFNREI